MSAIGMSAPRGKFAPSIYADYRHDHMMFERQQSHALRSMEWEDRIQPLTPWSALLLRGAGAAAMLSLVVAFLI